MYATEFKSIILQEANALMQASTQILDSEILKSIQLLNDCKGKVIVTGVGKSGIIATKIAATLTSTGTMAVSLSASDAMHGDLGIVNQNDVLIAISNSGETQEILAILPHLKIRKISIISIVGNTNSTLALASDAVLNAKITKEAGHLHLAPTTSTTLALAIGDALAMSVMKSKNITENDFAINHPAGQLGKRLALKLSDIMHSNIVSYSKEIEWNNILVNITKSKLGAITITNENNVLEGIITDGDIRRTIEKTEISALKSLKAQDIMTKNPITILDSKLAFNALQLMENGNSQISILPVVDTKNEIKGIVRLHDIIGKI